MPLYREKEVQNGAEGVPCGGEGVVAVLLREPGREAEPAEVYRQAGVRCCMQHVLTSYGISHLAPRRHFHSP